MADAQLNNPNYPLPFFMADASDRAKGVTTDQVQAALEA